MRFEKVFGFQKLKIENQELQQSLQQKDLELIELKRQLKKPSFIRLRKYQKELDCLYTCKINPTLLKIIHGCIEQLKKDVVPSIVIVNLDDYEKLYLQSYEELIRGKYLFLDSLRLELIVSREEIEEPIIR
jgi:hypothetical protein